MNQKAIFEIGDIIHVRYKFALTDVLLSPEEIVKTYEYEMFKKTHPELCRLAEELP